MTTPRTLKETLESRLEALKQLRDEIHLDLHLAGMELRDEWRELERKIDLSGAADQLKEASAEALDRLAVEVRKFKERLHDGIKKGDRNDDSRSQ